MSVTVHHRHGVVREEFGTFLGAFWGCSGFDGGVDLRHACKRLRSPALTKDFRRTANENATLAAA